MSRRSSRARLATTAIATAMLGAIVAEGCGKTDADKTAAVSALAANPTVILKTSAGEIELEMYPEKAPVSTANFLAYVDEGFYDGTIFHRVIQGFMVQGGGYDGGRQKKPTRAPIKNEADNGLKNEIGTLAMARTSVPESATSQFFINVENNAFLDHREPTADGWGYAVFGKVVSGMEVVESIAQAETEDLGGAFRNLPKSPVVIESARRKP